MFIWDIVACARLLGGDTSCILTDVVADDLLDRLCSVVMVRELEATRTIRVGEFRPSHGIDFCMMSGVCERSLVLP